MGAPDYKLIDWTVIFQIVFKSYRLESSKCEYYAYNPFRKVVILCYAFANNLPNKTIINIKQSNTFSSLERFSEKHN